MIVNRMMTLMIKKHYWKKGKLPIIYFTCNKVGHIAERHPKTMKRRGKITNIEEGETTKITREKLRSLVTLLKKMVLKLILLNMMKKLFMLK